VPSHDDQHLFEMLVLEGAQAGLSWSTILNRREGYRKVYEGFDPSRVARFSAKKIETMLLDPGIIRNRSKVESSINNAKAFLKVQEEFGTFAKFMWQFVDGKPIVHKFKELSEIPVSSRESDAFSKELKQRGFSFVGTTICYAHMQAVGMVNDHLVSCFRYKQV